MFCVSLFHVFHVSMDGLLSGPTRHRLVLGGPLAFTCKLTHTDQEKSQSDHKETEDNHKVKQNNYKETQNDYKVTPNDKKDIKLPQRNPKNTQNNHRDTHNYLEKTQNDNKGTQKHENMHITYDWTGQMDSLVPPVSAWADSLSLNGSCQHHIISEVWRDEDVFYLLQKRKKRTQRDRWTQIRTVKPVRAKFLWTLLTGLWGTSVNPSLWYMWRAFFMVLVVNPKKEIFVPTSSS